MNVYLLDGKKLYKMAKTKKVTVSMTEETKQKALDLSVLVLGTENISGYISYLINKAHLEAEK